MTMITPSYLGETIEYSSLHACRSTLEDPTDVGSVMLEENVVRAAGVTNCTTEEELRRIIRDAGFRPAQRDTLYRQYFLN